MSDSFPGRFPSRILHGGDYNPDQWRDRPDVLAMDLDLMRRAGVNTVTLGVFAWSSLEPEPDRFDFAWLEERFEALHAAEIGVMLATPGGAMPAWLAAASPEALRTDTEGRRMPWSWRNHHCPSSPVFWDRLGRIVSELARRFGRHPALRAWHLNNELGGQCFCSSCLAAFREWLQARHGSLEALNRHWGNAVWSHTISDWGQITPFDPSNDGQQLDWLRFSSDQHQAGIRREIAWIRPHSERPVTTNFLGFGTELDCASLAGELDFVSDDQYPAYHGGADRIREAERMDLTQDWLRGMAGNKPWILMECTPSVTNKSCPPKLKRPGMHTLQMHQALARGADGTLMFQWRQCTAGREKFHGAVVGHDGGAEHPVFRDVAAYGRSLAALDGLPGARVPARAALVLDWESRMALRVSCGPALPGDSPKDPKGYLATCQRWHAPFARRGVPVDVIPASRDFSGYRLLLLPMLFLMEPTLTGRIRAFVEAGGVALATALCGVVDRHNRCHQGSCFGAGLPALFGVTPLALDGLDGSEGQGIRMEDTGRVFPLHDLACLPRVGEAEVMARYTADFYRGEAALTRRRVGEGEAWWLGTLGDEALADHLVDRLLNRAGLHRCLPEPVPGLSHAARISGDTRFDFFLNFTPKNRVFRFQPAPGAPVSDIRVSACHSHILQTRVP